MKTVVITGSARGFGLEMLKLFRKENFNTVICDVNEEAIKGAKENLEKINGKGKVLAYQTDITKEEEVNNLISEVKKETKEIDIWINNAGVNQPNKPIWEVDKKTIDRLINIDLKGTILCSKLIMKVMIDQKHG